MTGVVVDEVEPGDPVVHELIALGDRSRRTLGLMPRAAYVDAADHRRLVVAKIDSGAVGYALLRLPRSNQVVLSHLCVSDDARGKGVARALVDYVKDRHSGRFGIRAKCRDDYDSNPMWEALGFEARSAAIGRGKDQSPMTVWWLDHGHPDLFSFLVEPEIFDDEPDLLDAALDVNILMDLHTRADHVIARRSQVLVADHLEGRLRLVVTDGLDRDLARHPKAQREPIEAAAATYPRRSAPAAETENLFAQLKAASGHKTLSAQDEGDLWQIAAAVTAGVGVLLTWDAGLRNRFETLREAIPALGSFRVYDPDHLVTHLDELARAWAYQPARLQGSDFDRVRAGADDESDLQAFLNNSSGEKRGEFRDTLRELVRRQVPRWLIRTGDEPPVACYASRLQGEVLQVPLLRLADHQLSDTVARQLLWMLRRDACDQQARAIDITDRHMGDALTRAATFDAFHRSGDHWYAWVIPTCGPSEEITHAANQARALVQERPGPLIRPSLDPRAAAEVERTLWPAKITDSALPHYIIPIQSQWSSELLGHPAQLTSRPIELALGREQVYYRTADNLLSAPARILWRVSQGRNNAAEIIGTSLLDAIDTDTPQRLHEAFRHYGVFELRHLQDSAKTKNVVQALRFSDTELFDTPITERAYQALRTRHGGPKTFYSPRRINAELFTTLYQAANPR